MFGIIDALFGSNDSRTNGRSGSREGGVNAILDVLNQRTDSNPEVMGVLGEPEIRDYATAADLENEYKVVVPVTVERYENPAPLVFDLPDGFDDYAADFYQFANGLGITGDAFDAIEGTEIPMGIVNNAIVPATHLIDENIDTFYNDNGVPDGESPVQDRSEGDSHTAESGDEYVGGSWSDDYDTDSLLVTEGSSDDTEDSAADVADDSDDPDDPLPAEQQSSD